MMRLFLTIVVLLFSTFRLSAQSTYGTGFEPPFALGDVAGQFGWNHHNNSPTKGTIDPVPPGSPAMMGVQSLAIRTRNVDFFGVTNHLYSPTIGSPAGEPGSTLKSVPVANPQTHFAATLWVRTPSAPVISSRADRRLGQLNPSSRDVNAQEPVGDRYASVRLFNTTNTAGGLVEVRLYWPQTLELDQSVTVATLDWNRWYRFDYLIEFVPGLNDGAPNDRFGLSIYDDSGVLVGSACGTTWEVGWRSGGWGGPATPRAVNGFDLAAETAPNDTIVAFIDQMTMTAFTPTEGPLQATVTGSSSVCAGGTTLLTAAASGGSGSVSSYEWRNESEAIVGTGPTLTAGPGAYTVMITDPLCVSATSQPFTVTELPPLVATIAGPNTVCCGGSVILTANASGGSETITGYEWRNAANEVVGTGQTLQTGAGTYTVTVVDATCGPVSSAAHAVAVVPTIAIADLSANEGDSGTTTFTVAVTLSDPAPSQVSVQWTTANGSATGADYSGASGTLVIPATASGGTIEIAVIGETDFEPNETFTITLTGASGGTIVDGESVVTILNDDGARADLSIAKSGPATALAATNVNYEITVTNAGPQTASAVVVTDVLPAGTTLVSATPSQGSCSGTSTVLCTAGSLPSGSSMTIALVVTTPAVPTTIVNSATVTNAAESDPTVANNQSEVSTTLEANPAVPTLSEWLLLLLGGLLASAALLRLR
jgi:uncharacterized repeat protein (TIGR01451 family)